MFKLTLISILLALTAIGNDLGYAHQYAARAAEVDDAAIQSLSREGSEIKAKFAPDTAQIDRDQVLSALADWAGWDSAQRGAAYLAAMQTDEHSAAQARYKYAMLIAAWGLDPNTATATEIGNEYQSRMDAAATADAKIAVQDHALKLLLQGVTVHDRGGKVKAR
jgi:hypothetical protein